MTAEEFCAWAQRPENDGRWCELVEGEIVEEPPPTRPQSVVSARISALLWGYAETQRGLYVTGNGAGVLLRRDPDTVRGPEVAVFNDAVRYKDLHPMYGEVPPLLAVKVVQPNARHGQLARMVEDYLRAGVRLFWLVDCESRNVTVYPSHTHLSVVEVADEITGEDVLPDLRCRVSDFFRLPGEKPAAS